MALNFLPLWGGSDLAAETSNTAVPLLGLADAADVATVEFPFPVELAGIVLGSNNASGDTVQVWPIIGGTVNTAMTAQVNHVITAASTLVGVGQGIAVPAYTTIGLDYQTTTSGSYTAKDVFAGIWIRVLGAGVN